MSTTDVSVPVWRPPQPDSLEATGLTPDLVMQLMLKDLHIAGELSGTELARQLGVAFSVIEPGFEALKAQRLCEIVGGTNFGPPSYRYRITMAGRDRAVAALAASTYRGFAPVPLAAYRRYMTSAFGGTFEHRISPADVAGALSHLVLSSRVLEQLGPAVNSGQSLFIYGPPGNGKTAIAQAIGKLLVGDIWIPHAIEVDGTIIRVFDPVNHEPLPEPPLDSGLEKASEYDRRWVRCRRPAVTVGAELGLEALDLVYTSAAGACRPPMQLLANGGVLVIDDFGRQKCTPRELLNRWVHPLETRVDYLTLQSGQKIDVPFLVLPVFATNIRPAALLDEAFLRRIQYKVLAENPTPAEYTRIFENFCRERELEFDPAIVEHLLERVLIPKGIALHGCQPRDLITQALALAQYRDEPRRLTIPLLEAACDSYFIDEEPGIGAAQ
jgi:hypothetical protein